MPIEKIQVIHKFGIISQNHKRILQERLLKLRNQEYIDEQQKVQNMYEKFAYYIYFNY
jgi:hypothetical protein